MMNGLVVFARCSYPILVQLRWGDEVLDLSSNPSMLTLMLWLWLSMLPIISILMSMLSSSLVDGFVDGLATLYLVDVVVYLVVVVVLLLCNAVMRLSNF